MTPRLSPHNELAERRLLAGLLREPQLVTEACIHHGVTVEDFFHSHHRIVWNAAWSLIDSGLVPDLAGVWQTLVCRGEERELDAASPAAWMADLYDEDPTGAWCDWSCVVILELAKERAVIHSAHAMLADPRAWVQNWQMR